MKTVLLLTLFLVQASCMMPSSLVRSNEVVIHSKDLPRIKNAILDEMGRVDRRFTLERETGSQLILSQPMPPLFVPRDIGWVLSRAPQVENGGRAADWRWHKLIHDRDPYSFKSVAQGRVFESWTKAGATQSDWAWFMLQPIADGTLVKAHHELRVFFVSPEDPDPASLSGGKLPNEAYEPRTDFGSYFSTPRNLESQRTIRCASGVKIFALPTGSNDLPIILRDVKGWTESGKQPPYAGSRNNLLRP